MRKNILTALLGLYLTVIYSQPLEQIVVGSSGTTYLLNNVQLDWTMGEVFIHSLENPFVQITQGFHQPEYNLVSIHEFPKEVGIITLFPNPVKDILKIQITLQKPSEGILELFDQTGKLIWRNGFMGDIIHEDLPVSHLSDGEYLLRVSLDHYQTI